MPSSLFLYGGIYLPYGNLPNVFYSLRTGWLFHFPDLSFWDSSAIRKSKTLSVSSRLQIVLWKSVLRIHLEATWLLLYLRKPQLGWSFEAQNIVCCINLPNQCPLHIPGCAPVSFTPVQEFILLTSGLAGRAAARVSVHPASLISRWGKAGFFHWSSSLNWFSHRPRDLCFQRELERGREHSAHGLGVGAAGFPLLAATCS